MQKQVQQETWRDTISEMALLLMLVFLIRTFGFGLYQVPTGSMETTMLVGERFFADKFSYVFRTPRRGEIIAFNDPLYHYSKNPVGSLFQHYVWGPTNWTKRVIGIPGDRVRGAVEDGKPVVYLNDEKLAESYLNKYPLIEQVVDGVAHWRSYDPNASYADQPFYRMHKRQVPRRVAGASDLLHPSTPQAASRRRIKRDGQYWDGSDIFNVVLRDNEYWLMGDNRRGSSDCRVFGPIQKKLIHGRIVFRIWSVDSTQDWWIADFLKHPIDFWQRIRWSRFFQWIN